MASCSRQHSSAVTVTDQVAAVTDRMDIAAGEQQNLIGHFQQGPVVMVRYDNALDWLESPYESLYPFYAHRGKI